MKKFLTTSAALLLFAAVFPTLAAAVDLSADLQGANANQEGFASLAANGNTIRFTALTNGIGTPTRAVVRRGGDDVVELDATFTFGTGTGTTTSAQFAAILANPASYAVRIEGPDGTIEGPIVGVAGAAGITVDPLRRNFADVAVGTNSTPRIVTVSNTGDRNYRITLVGLFGASRAQYSIVNDACSGTALAPNQSCVIQFRFEPAATGTQKALLVIRSNDANNAEYRVQLRGNGI